jgi:hypothetical protein
VRDPILQNAWGVAFSSAASPFWISDNATGCSTRGADRPRVERDNEIPGPVPAAFIFDTEDGTISAWAGGLTPFDAAVLAVDNSSVPTTADGAVYKGLAFGTNVDGVFLFATNFRAGTIDVFAPAPAGSTTGHYVPATTDGGFKDPSIPPGYAPFGIQNINGDLFVTYAKQNAQKHDDIAGPGHGFVDVFDTDGHLLRRFATRGELNSPWGRVPTRSISQRVPTKRPMVCSARSPRCPNIISLVPSRVGRGKRLSCSMISTRPDRRALCENAFCGQGVGGRADERRVVRCPDTGAYRCDKGPG